MDSVYRPGSDTPFSPFIYDNIQMEGSTAAKPIIVDNEEDKEKSAPTTTTTTPESERPTEPLPSPPDYWEDVVSGLD